jgi:DNA-binding NtrC family response regulator
MSKDPGTSKSAPPSSSLGRQAGASQRPLVLVIDDDSVMRETLEALLSSKYDVIACASAEEGARAFNEDVASVIVDVKMEGRDGFWACNEIRKRQPDVPVIFYSAYQDAKDPFQIINEHRPFGYITKDGNPKRLLDVLETSTRLYQAMIRLRHLLKKLKEEGDPESFSDDEV